MTNPLGTINDIDSQLAVELASEISPIDQILQRHSLTPEDLKLKLSDPHFKNIYREAKRVWSSDLSVRERIKVKSAVLVEDSLIKLYQIFNDADIAAPARLEAFKSMAKVAEVYEVPKTGTPTGERVTVNINLGGGHQPLTIEGTAQLIEEGAEI